MAIYLAWDLLYRFPGFAISNSIRIGSCVADEEAQHFELIRSNICVAYKVEYGNLPAHGGLCGLILLRPQTIYWHD